MLASAAKSAAGGHAAENIAMYPNWITFGLYLHVYRAGCVWRCVCESVAPRSERP